MTDIMYCKLCNEKFNKNDTDKFDRHLQFVHGTNHWDIALKLQETKKLLKDMMDNKEY